MAQVVVYLQGGPCNGKTHTLTKAEAQADEVHCKRSIYRPGIAPAYHGSYQIFAYRGAVPKPKPKPEPTPTTPQALKGWADLRKSINRGMPTMLDYSERVNRATLRTLRRARRVKG